MPAKSWLWPDRTIGKAESRILREEHNALVNLNAELLESLDWLVIAASTEPSMDIYRAHIQMARERIAAARGVA